MDDFEVKAITSKYCDDLVDQANLNPSLYIDHPKTFPLETKQEFYARGSTMIYLKESEFKKFKSEVEGGENNKTQNDLHNSRVLYRSLVYRDSDGNEYALSPLQASDKRVWNFLAHHEHFWNYVYNRWGANPKTSRFILRNISITNLTHHALSRLWWYAEICYDKENRTDPLALLDVLCTNADVLYSLSEKLWFANRKVAHSILRFLSKPENKKLLRGDTITEVSKVFTTETGIRDLPMLNSKELERLFATLFER